MTSRDPAASDSPPPAAGVAVADSPPSPGRPIVNYFDSAAVAARYAASRPAGHDRVLQVLRQTLAAELPFAHALDVGCGTGSSSVALLPYAETITGVDASSEMLAQACRHPRIHFHKAHAEALPFRSDTFDLVTVSSAYHWFDHHLFLAEAARVIRAGRCLVLYKAGSTGTATDQPAFDRWRREALNVRYPKVARNHDRLTADLAAAFGFREIACETMTHQRRYSLDEYVDNLLTHSSVIRAVDGGRESVAAARTWLRAELAPFFPNGEADFTHADYIHVLRRAPKS
ncbi:MAG TPA: methyltransferase domain-containing protein [Opitutaceae bacterium]|nr:methyltransferase domain-containing protein [Opitutaceae bacterium]